MRMQLSVILAVLCVGTWAFAQGGAQGVDRTKESAPTAGTMHEQGMESGHMGHEYLAQALVRSPNEIQIQGKYLDYKDVSVGNSKDTWVGRAEKDVGVGNGKDHRLARIELKDGKIRNVDLGPKDNLPKDFGLNKDQWVIVTGVEGRLNNETVLVAHNWANVYNMAAEGTMPSGTTSGSEHIAK